MTEDEVLSFIRRTIKSAWSLELLLLMRRERQAAWIPEMLVRELRGSIALVTESLVDLTAVGLVAATEGGYAYRPSSPELEETVDALSELYANKPLAVLHAIFTAPNDKIRSFADAFLFKKKSE